MEWLIESGHLQQLLGVLVAICAVLLPAAIVFIVLHFRQRRASETLETVRYLADKGLPVPAELFPAVRGASKAFDPRALTFTALSLLGAGVGLMIFFYTWELMRFLWGVGALVATIGLAQLLGLWLTRRRATDDVGSAR
ncbi:MAG: DUF6249 domain-containing protein [Caldimonas sp.]